MYDPNNPQEQVPGMMQTMGAPNAMAALGGHGGNPFNGYHQAKMDWRGQRPEMTPGMAEGDWRTALMGWRGLKPNRMDFRTGQPTPAVPQAPPMAAPITNPTPPINGQLPLNPYGG